jgi:hypothetical protein
VPRAFERPFQGVLPLVRVGWAMIRPQAAAPVQPAPADSSTPTPEVAVAPPFSTEPQASEKTSERPPAPSPPPQIGPPAAPLETVPLPRPRPVR